MHDIKRRIEYLQPEMQRKVKLWLNDLTYEKLPVWIDETLRTYDRQAMLYAKGRTTPGRIVTRAKPGQSYHAFGLAMDVYPMNQDGDPIFDFNPDTAQWRRIVTLARNRGLKWGGDWLRFRDYPHFELKAAPPLFLCRLHWAGGYKPSNLV